MKRRCISANGHHSYTHNQQRQVKQVRRRFLGEISDI
jgi:hypothetical protein